LKTKEVYFSSRKEGTMARTEMVKGLMAQIAELDMMIMTATTSELVLLESIRKDLEEQLVRAQAANVRLAA
jgi:hypothetical protein